MTITTFFLILAVVLPNAHANFARVDWKANYHPGNQPQALVASQHRVFVVGHLNNFQTLPNPNPNLNLNPNASTTPMVVLKQLPFIMSVSTVRSDVNWYLVDTEPAKYDSIALSNQSQTLRVATDKQPKPYSVRTFGRQNNFSKPTNDVSFSHIPPNRTLSIAHMQADENRTYLCGHTKTTFLEATSRMEIFAVNISGKVDWSLQDDPDRRVASTPSDCRKLVFSQNSTHIYALGTRFNVKGHVKILVYKLHMTKKNGGIIVWKSVIENTAGLPLYPHDIVHTEDAVFVSATLNDARQRMYVYKLSDVRGTLLWSREVCCTTILDRISGDGDSKGSIAGLRGLFQGSDRYLYTTGYYKSVYRQAQHISGVVSRISPYGDMTQKDISMPFSTFRKDTENPQEGFGIVIGLANTMFVLSTNTSRKKNGDRIRFPSLQRLTLQSSQTNVSESLRSGPYFAEFSLILHLRGLKSGPVVDLLIEKFRIARIQARFTEEKLVSTVVKTKVTFMLYDAYAAPNVSEAELKMKELFSQGKGKTMKSFAEQHFNLSTNSVVYLLSSLQVLRNGTTVPKAASTTGSNLWKIILGVVVGFVVVSFILLFAAAYYENRRRSRPGVLHS